MEKISVIIPVYNSERFVGTCIRSVLGQTYDSLEIIIVDDGSTDGSLGICQELSLLDDRVRILHQENAGVSAARNLGLDIALGKYVFFLDSDDAIHPLLFEEMVGQMEEYSADLAFVRCKMADTAQMDRLMEEVSEEDARPLWQTMERERSDELLHCTQDLSGIGGKLIRRDFIGPLRFERGLVHGEDTLFIYYLACKQMRIVYSHREWYFYRQHGGNTTYSPATIKDKQYLKSCRVIRDSEYQKKHVRYALKWENILVFLMETKFSLVRDRKDRECCRNLRKMAAAEARHPLFRELEARKRWLFLSLFFCYPLYIRLRRLFVDPVEEVSAHHPLYYKLRRALWIRRNLMGDTLRENDFRIGILPACPLEDHGQMLQAYGLKKYLQDKGIRTQIVPYMPLGKGKWARKYLFEKGQKRIWRAGQLKRLPFQYYILLGDPTGEMDQNPFLPDFRSKRKEKMITYEADPVFLLKKEMWQEIEKLPQEKGDYILLDDPEMTQKPCDFAGSLSEILGLPVVDLQTKAEGWGRGFPAASGVDPAQFLGYIDKAAYVVTSSFCGAAFSIIYQKDFMAFPCGTQGIRLKELLRGYGLMDRCCGGEAAEAEMDMNWEEVKKITEKNVRLSEDFLMKNAGR